MLTMVRSTDNITCSTYNEKNCQAKVYWFSELFLQLTYIDCNKYEFTFTEPKSEENEACLTTTVYGDTYLDVKPGVLIQSSDLINLVPLSLC